MATPWQDATRRGWRVFPLRPGSKTPAVRDWETWARTDPDPAWWSEEDQGYGIACGPSRLLVVDLDQPDGTSNWYRIQQQVGDPTNTYTTETPSGGLHLYYTQNGQHRNTASKLAPRIDTRGAGGYVVGYPPILDIEPRPVPPWLALLLERIQPTPTPASPWPNHRWTVDTSRYGRSVIRAEVARVTSAAEGTRNHTLNLAAFKLGQLIAGQEVSLDHATQALTDAAQQIGLHPHETHKTIESGLAAGMRQPRKRTDR